MYKMSTGVIVRGFGLGMPGTSNKRKLDKHESWAKLKLRLGCRFLAEILALAGPLFLVPYSWSVDRDEELKIGSQ